MPWITFKSRGRFECEDGETIFEVARRHDVPVDTSCVGQGTCGLCRVKIVGGEENLPPYGEVEKKHLGNVYFITKVRLSCQCPVSGDVVVELVTRRK